MSKISLVTYDLNPKNKDKERKPKIETAFDIHNIMALTTARGSGKWCKLYVSEYKEPLELPNQSFDATKEKLSEAAKKEVFKEDIFILVGKDILVNQRWVKTVKTLSGEIDLKDDHHTTLKEIEKHWLEDFEKNWTQVKQILVEIQNEAWKKLSDYITTSKDSEYKKRLHMTTKAFEPLNNSLMFNGCLLSINSLIGIILLVIMIILLCNL